MRFPIHEHCRTIFAGHRPAVSGAGSFQAVFRPLRLALKVAANTALGFLALIALDLFSPLLGLHIGVNLVNALVVGILGLPGLALLVLSQWVFLL